VPRYHFHIADAETLRDEDGLELANLEMARLEAIKSLGEFLIHQPREVLDSNFLAMTVTDAIGLTLFRLDVMVTQAPVVR
jgi:hypothetical protein